jgi:RimJ/RimL family protein N-acetyltransferase
MKIEGKKIILRSFEIDDAKNLQEIRQDYAGIKSFAGTPFPSNIESEREWISRMYPRGDRKNIYLAVSEKQTGKFCGYCNARNINYLNRNAEVGVILHKNARGLGLFKEISFMFYDYLFFEINLHKVYSFVIQSNEIAIETDKKIGFIVEGLLKEHIYQDGLYKDVYFVSLYKNIFLEKNKEFNRNTH